MMIRNIVLLCLVGSICIQCKSDKKSSPVKGEETLTVSSEFNFTSNPQEVPEQEIKTLEIGASAPNFKLPGVDGKYHSLSDYASAEVLVIVFTCNHCPTAQAYEERIKKITADFANQNVQLIAISPNSPLGLLYEELGYSDLGDTYEDMLIRAKEQDFNFPYLYDGDTQEVTLAYGPVATPHVFVFNKARTLEYVGRIDGSEKPGTANGEDLRNAITQILAGNPIDHPVTKTFGCSTKWGWKTKMRGRVDKQWAEKEVELTEMNIEEIKGLLKNDSDKLRLLNIWATWCGPCRLEYPDFIVVQRMFGARDFEFVSLSADNLSKKEDALKFLKKSQSAVPNYIATTKDKYELIEAVDPEWNGALPYTVLIEPGGNVVWRHQGEADFQELKRTIVDHKMIGRVY
ncbi:redoxin domain-containing protein [Muriicola sp. Z0-33]|uniref:redoxin domain-containing protein n=1 Tax=Muriicola sp. Z0-33 TaxID=2816957 RepID=UPI002237EFEC|nr:redoxin domain-containing protein [Muriicola sp. Z0-33]MCW5515943.1 redoxin domain-containing protein [Muriicola sp. Z0-33]